MDFIFCRVSCVRIVSEEKNLRVRMGVAAWMEAGRSAVGFSKGIARIPMDVENNV